MNSLRFLLLLTTLSTTTAFAPRSHSAILARADATSRSRSSSSSGSKSGSRGSWQAVRLPILNNSLDDGGEKEQEDQPETGGTATPNVLTNLFSGWTSMDMDALSNKLDVATILKNIKSNEVPFGERGEVYFFAQALLVGCILLGGVPIVGEALSLFSGPISILAGMGVVTCAVWDLGGDSLSPFPATTSSSTLKTTGIYQELRHPMYAGLLLIMLGFAIATDSATRLVLTIGLGYLIEIKSTKEEEFLLESFPEYSDYQEQVPEKFFPKSVMQQLPWNQ
jgi:protein-S-isoprenylcysteine O-methyltransferase Ste14